MSWGSTKVFHVAHPANGGNGNCQEWAGVDKAIKETQKFVKKEAASNGDGHVNGGRKKWRKHCQPITSVSGTAHPDILHTATGHIFASDQPEKTHEKLKDELQVNKSVKEVLTQHKIFYAAIKQFKFDCIVDHIKG